MISKEKINYQIEVMAIAGYALVVLQRVEWAIAECWHISLPFGEPFTFEIIERLREKHRKKTLGYFFEKIDKQGMFKDSFKERFKNFIDDRNFFIHHMFTTDNEKGFFTKKGLRKSHAFLSRLINESLFMERIFDAYLAIIVAIGLEKGFYKGTQELKNFIESEHVQEK
jgi:hypothetical protein